jgi:hypothetical protein
LVTDDTIGSQREFAARLQLDFLDAEVADAHLRPRQIRHDGDALAGRLLGGADVSDGAPMYVELAVREVQSGNVHAGADHLPEDGRRF